MRIKKLKRKLVTLDEKQLHELIITKQTPQSEQFVFFRYFQTT